MSAVTTSRPGDSIYTQYSIVKTLPINSVISIVKGNIYTVNADGYLISLAAAAGVITNMNGPAIQAMASSAAVAGEAAGDRRVQCLMHRSRVILKAPADITINDDVAVAATGTTVTADKVQIAGTSDKIGSVYEILTLGDGRREKPKTEDGDLIVVDLLG